MANKRNEVRKFRHAKDTADDAFLNKLMPYLTSGEPVAIVPTNLLMEGVGAMQNIRKTHYSVEHDYEHMEQHLDREESKLFDLEADLFHFLSGPDDIDRRDWKSSTAPIEDVEHDSEEWDDKNDDDNQSTSRISLLGITGELKGEIHPLYRDLADAVGECELAKEHLDELWNHHEKLLEELELNVYRVRNEQGKTLSEEELDFLKSLLTHIPGDAQEFEDRFGFEGDEDDLEFFQDYSLREAQAQKNLEEATQKANQLMQICSEKGVMRRNPEFNEEYTIYLDASLPPGDNMTINLPTMAAKDLANPRFPMLLSNPSHVLDLLSPIEALQRAMKLSKDDPNDQANFRQKVACMKEMGISMLMKNATNTPDYISEWLVHKLRTSPLEAELLFSICEGLFKITDRHKWQEQVLQHWQSDGANSFPHGFEAPLTPNYEVPEIEHVGGSLVNSAITVTPAPPAEPPAEEPPAEEPPAAEPPAAEPQDEAGPELTTKT
ncbi:hypothetical protein B0T17DRAFT_612525 [Bombardia bombarda]|uniref:Uncharacterized protein n=1 Tax=Bombardia bombarda TaxID=252184 RepID=A0AA39XKJ0_9PEZI|nr:hypothetical protein B0T17DRAFT_612525 [Bombardia bombarda]